MNSSRRARDGIKTSVSDARIGKFIDIGCNLRRRFANDASVSTASPSSTGGNTTMLTADQP